MNEKRQYFRIQQDVIFNFKSVHTDDVNQSSAEEHFDHAGALGVFNKFQQIDNDSHEILSAIAQSQPLVADYLTTINQKLNLLSQQILANEAVSVYDSDSGRIDLSQGGLGFAADHPIGIESWLAIKLVFVPSYTGIISYAQVTRNELQADGSYLIGARFHGLNEEQEKIIAKQVMQTQIVHKRRHRSLTHH